jgi:sugar lactone lactonase YvrE
MKFRIPLLALILGTLALWNGASLHAVPPATKAFIVSTLMKSGGVGLFNNLAGITADGQGNLYVADQDNQTIRKIDSNNNVTTIAGQVGVEGSADGQGTNASFYYPSGITIDGQGNLYVTDQDNQTIRKIDSNNNVTTIAGQVGNTGSANGQGTNATFSGPNGITADGQGNLYVVDQDNSTIRKIDSNNNVTTIAGRAGYRFQGSADGQGTNASFSVPAGITADGQGNLYVVDQNNFTIRKIDSNNNVTTIAGQAGISGSADGQGTNASFNYPNSITCDGQGNLYVTDPSNQTIRKIDSNNNVTTIAGQVGNQGSANGQGTNATFYYPTGITSDSQGNLYVTDLYNETIRKVDSNDTVTTIAGQVGLQGSSDGPATNVDWFITPAITVDGQGNLFVADNVNNDILKIGTNDSVTTIAGQVGNAGSANGQGTNASFNTPNGITVDSKGNLYVADSGNDTIRKIGSNNNVTTIAGQAGISGRANGQGTNATFYYPTGITRDGQGNLYVTDLYNDTIRKIDSSNNVTTIAGQAGISGRANGQGTNATFYYPTGITRDGQGNLYVTDLYNDTIRKIDSSNNVTTIAGHARTRGSADGQGTNATFALPAGITSDSQGNLYVADQHNDTIRKIDTNLNVTTLSGQAGVSGSADGQGTNATFDHPTGITVDSKGNFYLSDQNTIRQAAFITPASQTISFKALPAKAYGDASFPLNARASSGLSVSYTSSDTNVAVVSSNTLTIVGVGSATITASQLGGTYYTAATPVSQILTVDKGTQSISFGKIPAKTYAPNSTFSLTATNSSGLSVSYASSNTNVATVSGSLVTITGAGSTTITASQTSNANFKAALPVHQVLTVAKATPSFLFLTSPTEPFVQGKAFTLAAESSSNLLVTFTSSNPHIISISGTTATIHAKGTVTITASLSGDGNYKPAVQTAQVTVTAQENP